MYYCYILYSLGTDIFYIDSTGDLDLALVLHNSARVASTKPHMPWEMVWHEDFGTEQEAQNFARHLKSRVGTEFVYKRLLSAIFPGTFGNQANRVFES